MWGRGPALCKQKLKKKKKNIYREYFCVTDKGLISTSPAIAKNCGSANELAKLSSPSSPCTHVEPVLTLWFPLPDTCTALNIRETVLLSHKKASQLKFSISSCFEMKINEKFSLLLVPLPSYSGLTALTWRMLTSFSGLCSFRQLILGSFRTLHMRDRRT